MGCPLSPQLVPHETPVTAEGSHLERFIPAVYLWGSDLVCSGSVLAVRFGGSSLLPTVAARSPGRGTERVGPRASAPQAPRVPGQLPAARHRDHHHRLVPPDPGRAEQGLGAGPAGRAAPAAPGRVRVLGRPADESQVHPRPGDTSSPSSPKGTWVTCTDAPAGFLGLRSSGSTERSIFSPLLS